MSGTEQTPVFRDLTAEDPEPEVTEVESFCVNCHANGITRLMMTRIPHFRNVVLMSFSCEECGLENNEVQPGGAVAEMGVRWKLNVELPEDLNRQVVKSDYTSVRIPALEFEIPAQSQRGEVTTVEGILSRAITGLTLAAAREQGGPGGNTFIENPELPRRDPRCVRADYARNKEQDHLVGVFTREEIDESPTESPKDAPPGSYERLAADEVLRFPTNCPNCNAPADTNMKITKIPHFKEVIIMATVCDSCGHRTNEVKSGAGAGARGARWALRLRANKDWGCRDVLKSETCNMQIPELDLDVGGRALGGRFTTAEGLLRAAAEQLRDAAGGDAPWGKKGQLETFLSTLEEVIEGRREATLVLDDPAGNTYVQSTHDDIEEDEDLSVTYYERTFEQNEELGLNDMKTEGYEQDS